MEKTVTTYSQQRLQATLLREHLHQLLACAAWSKLDPQYRLPEREKNTFVIRQGTLVSPQSGKGESLVITQEYEKYTNGSLQYYLVLRLMVDSLAVKANTVALTVAFNIDGFGGFQDLNTAMTQSEAFLDADKLTALLEATRTWLSQTPSQSEEATNNPLTIVLQ